MSKLCYFKIELKKSYTNLFVSMEKKPIRVTAQCPIRTTLDLVGGKWKLMILSLLQDKPMRPSELRKFMPDVSEKMLIENLKILANDALITRIKHNVMLPKVEYAITDNGRRVMPLIEAMVTFANEYQPNLTN